MPADKLKFVLHKLSFLHSITELMHGLLLIGGLMVLPYAFAREQFGLLLGWSIVAYMLLYLVRRLSRKMWQILILSFLVVASPLLPIWDISLIPQLIIIPSLLILAIRSFTIRIRAEDPDPTNLVVSQGGALLYMLALNIFVVYFEFMPLSQAYFYIAIVYLIAGIYRFHTYSLTSQMSRFMAMPTQPAHRIKHFNQMMMLAFGLVMVVLLLISPLLRLHDLVPMLGGLLLAFLRWITRLLSRESEPLPDDLVPEETQPDAGLDPGMMPEAKDPALWMLILQEIFYYLMIILTVAALLAVVVTAIIAIYKRFYATDHGPDVFESLMPKFGEDVKVRLKRTRARFLSQFGRGHDQKIRRIYWRVLDRLAQKGLEYSNKQSPRQFAYYVMQEQSIDILDMTRLYEKARYGPGPCSAEDVAMMQKLFQQWRQNRNDAAVRDKGEYDR